MKKILVSLLMASAAILSACGGGDDEPAMVAANDTTLGVNLAAAQAVAKTPFNFTNGVPALGTTGTTTVTITGTNTTPPFSIVNGSNSATGTMNFGSCIFAVTQSSFPVGHPLATGQTVTVNPCNLNVNTAGAVANGVATTRSVALLLGSAASAGSSVTIAVTAGGALTLNGNAVATITLTPVSGGGS